VNSSDETFSIFLQQDFTRMFVIFEKKKKIE